ncbi:UvrD-helicase domain-containing protein [Halostagnicola kamekurae]|uniref:UvrD-helicase domain-containing protein n=1 Tax=Halostagnicola kamekurae TaxID=619731 RepID=UPI000B866E99
MARAGSGKTLLFAHRITYLIECGVDPERIVAITLTNESTAEIQDRLKDRFGIIGVEVRTTHGFANAIAREARTGRVDVVADHRGRERSERRHILSRYDTVPTS